MNCVNQQHSFYTSWSPWFGFSPEQFETKYKAEVEERPRRNPVIRLLSPAPPRFFRLESRLKQDGILLCSQFYRALRTGPASEK